MSAQHARRYAGWAVGIFGPVLPSLLYGREYRNATAILNILVLEMIVTGSTLVLTRAFMPLGRPGYVTFLQSSGLLLSIPLLVVLVPRWGVLGASYALLTAALIRFAFALGSLPLILKQPVPGVLPKMWEFGTLAVRFRNGLRGLRDRLAAGVANA